MRASLVVGEQRLTVDAPAIHLIAEPSRYRSGMIGILDLGEQALFIVAPVIRVEKS
ncbi:MAG TPA: hypothetical protein VOA88_05960 [Candidatus Dormibacteraeota bacterium]|nr:hypothetical protein [Candidatus Dormibacteraeota bacterium]